MSKLFKRVSGITLGLALCFGFSFGCNNKQSSSQMARADDELSYTVTPENLTGWTSTQVAQTGTSDIFTLVAAKSGNTGGGANNTQIRIYSGATFTLSCEEGYKMTKAVFTCTANGDSSNGPKKLSGTGYTGGTSKTGTWEGDAASFTLNATAQCRVTSIDISYYQEGGSGTKLGTPSVQFDKINKQVTWEAIENASSYTLVVDGGTAVENATSPYPVDSLTSGVSHTVTVTAIGDGTNYTDSSAGSVTFSFLEHAGTADDPYTVADARAAIDANDGVTDVYATGIVSQIVTAYSAEYGNISYNISSDGLTTSSQLQAYRGKGVGGANFTSADDIQVGDIVVVKGTLTKHNSTYEFAANNQLVSLTRPNAPVLQYLEMSGVPVSEYKTTDTSWDPTGLKIDAYYDNGTSKDVTSLVTWSYDLGSPNEVGVGDYCVSFIASYGDESVSDDFNVSVAEVAIVNTYNLGGNYNIYVADASDNSIGAWINDGSEKNNNGAPKGVGDQSLAGIYTLTLVEDDTFTITLGNDYLYTLDTNNGVKLNSKPNDESYKWIVSMSGEYYLFRNKLRSTRYLSYYAEGNDIRTYGNTNLANVTLSEAKTFSSFDIVCTVEDNKNVLKDSVFNATVAAEKGFKAIITYTDNSTLDVTSKATWSLDTSTTGPKTLTATYLTYSASINDMNIYVITFDYLEVIATNAKVSYHQGDTLNTAGLVINGKYGTDGSHEINVEDVTFSSTTLDTVGEQTITVTYTNSDASTATGTYTVTVSEFEGYDKATSMSDLKVGDAYVVGSPNNNSIMGGFKVSGAKSSSGYMESLVGDNYFNAQKTRVTSNLPEGTSVVTLLYAGENAFYMYNLSSSKFFQLSNTNSDFYEVDTMSEASTLNASFAANGQITLSVGSRLLGYNTNPTRYAAYASSYNSIALFKLGDSSLESSLTTSFANEWLKMNDENYAGDIETPNCSENYEFLKAAYSELSDIQKNIFQYSDNFEAARARLNNWATANGETFTYGNEEPFAALRKTGVSGDILSPEDDSSLIILFIIGTLGAGALSAFYLMKKKKRA